MQKKILFESKGSIGTIILNDPKKLNSFNLNTIKQLRKQLSKIKKSKLKVIIIKGSGKSFCTGGKISWERSIGTLPAHKTKNQIKFIQDTLSEIEKLPQVVIAIIQGYAIGGGNELAMACDIRIALPDAIFAHPENTLGTIAPLGGTKRLPRLVGLGRAKYMLFTGEKIDSKTALDWGLIDFIVPKNKVKGFLNSLVQKIAKNPKKAIELTKKSVNKEYLKDLNDKFELTSYVKCSRSKENKKILDELLKSST